jgi:predicted nucleic acid-binding protein
MQGFLVDTSIWVAAFFAEHDSFPLANWRTQAHIRCIDAEPDGTRELWLELAATSSASPKVWMNAYLAAFAIRARLPFATLDTDFRRFEPAGLNLQFVVD